MRARAHVKPYMGMLEGGKEEERNARREGRSSNWARIGRSKIPNNRYRVRERNMGLNGNRGHTHMT